MITREQALEMGSRDTNELFHLQAWQDYAMDMRGMLRALAEQRGGIADMNTQFGMTLIERLRTGAGTSPDHLLLLEAADALETLGADVQLTPPLTLKQVRDRIRDYVNHPPLPERKETLAEWADAIDAAINARGEPTVEVTDEMVRRAHAAYYAAYGPAGDTGVLPCMRAAIEAALNGRT